MSHFNNTSKKRSGQANGLGKISALLGGSMSKPLKAVCTDSVSANMSQGMRLPSRAFCFLEFK